MLFLLPSFLLFHYYLHSTGESNGDWSSGVDSFSMMCDLLEILFSLGQLSPRLVGQRPHDHGWPILVPANELRERILVAREQGRREILRVDRRALVDHEEAQSMP
jgi:hypothetical protein